jgi:hypothetical protein
MMEKNNMFWEFKSKHSLPVTFHYLPHHTQTLWYNGYTEQHELDIFTINDIAGGATEQMTSKHSFESTCYRDKNIILDYFNYLTVYLH